MLRIFRINYTSELDEVGAIGVGAVASIKVLIQLFQKLAGSKDGVLGRGSQASKYPKHPKKFLFLLLFLLAKGEKEE